MKTEIASMLVSSGDGPAECRQAVSHVLRLIRAEAADCGLAADIVEREAAQGPSSAVVILNGPGAKALRAAWLGVTQWRCRSQLRPRHKRKNWFVEVFPLDPASTGQAIDPAGIEMQAIRAGGPGGQHQNKTSSAIRASWRSATGTRYTVVVRDQRSQHQNRRIATTRLQGLADADAAEAAAAQSGRQHRMHHALQRGGARRIFDGPEFHPSR